MFEFLKRNKKEKEIIKSSPLPQVPPSLPVPPVMENFCIPDNVEDMVFSDEFLEYSFEHFKHDFPKITSAYHWEKWNTKKLDFCTGYEHIIEINCIF